MRVLMHIGNCIPYISGFTNEVSHKYILLPTIFKSARAREVKVQVLEQCEAPTLWVCAENFARSADFLPLGEAAVGRGLPVLSLVREITTTTDPEPGVPKRQS